MQQKITVRKNEEKAEVLGLSLPLQQQDQMSPGYPALSGKRGRGSRMSPHIPEDAAVTLRHIHIYRAGWDPPEGAEQTAERAHRATSNHLPAVLAI